jgi:antitoxin (DNA-binding transcriptional repressor) of toxin-antitoxin stability system
LAQNLQSNCLLIIIGLDQSGLIRQDDFVLNRRESSMKKAINIYEAKAHLSRLIADLQKTGKPIIICRNRVPVADLVPHRKPGNPLKQNPALKGARFHGDPCAPVAEEDWPEELR